MEGWQTTHIKRNLPQLIELTDFNSKVNAVLRAEGILSDADVDNLEAKRNSNGNIYAASQFYDRLKKSKSAYEVLTKALLTNHQTDAAEILIYGMKMQGIEKPLTYLGIPLDEKPFKETNIKLLENTFKTKYLFSGQNLDDVCKIFKDCLPEVDYYKMFVNQDETFVLAVNTIPPEPSFYIPRYLSNRIKLDRKIFEVKCPDIFVFKNIERHELSDIVRPTVSSETQVEKLSSRLIHLDRDEDWDEIVKLATVPVHLINCETSQDFNLDNGTGPNYTQSPNWHFILEKTCGHSDILRKFGIEKDRAYISEHDFVNMQRTTTDIRGICICDTPGMGKTLLLQSIARGIAAKFPKNIVAFISLASFFETIGCELSEFEKTKNQAILLALKYLSTNQETAILLQNLVINQFIWVELFLDGFDEIQANQVEWAKQFMKTILENYNTVRIYVSSRPHMRHDLENTLEVIAFDMLPFDTENQANFLINFWLHKNPKINQEKIRSCASEFLSAVKEKLTTEDLDITGLPLQCMLIAEVYSDEAYTFCRTGSQHFRFTSRKTSEMYKRFIEKRMFHATSNEEETDFIRNVHVRHAYKLLFPDEQNHLETDFPDDVIESILKAGIMQQTIDKDNLKLEFVHRTFAEYLLAEYSADFFSGTRTGIHIHLDDINFLINCILLSYKLIGRDEWHITTSEWGQPGIVYFFDSLICTTAESDYITEKIATFFTMNQPKAMYDFIYAACEQNNAQVFQFWANVLILSEDNIIRKIFTKEKLASILLKIIKSFNNTNLLPNFVSLLSQVFQCKLSDFYELGICDSLLEVAAEYGNYEAVEYLLDKLPFTEKDLFFKCVSNSFSNTTAIAIKKVNILKLLLHKNPSLINEIPDILVKTLVHIKLINLLVKSGVDIYQARKGKTFLCKVHVERNRADFHELVKFILLEQKAEHLFKPNSSWQDPIPSIIENVALLPETLDLILAIPEIYIDDNINRENLLFYAVRGNKPNTVRELVRRGANLNKRGQKNISLLHVAKSDEMITYLIKVGLNPNCCDELGNTPLHFHPNISTIKVFQKHGANIFAKNKYGMTALFNTIGTMELRYLVNNGLDVNDCGIEGKTPMFYCKKLELVKCLLELGADIMQKLKTDTMRCLVSV